MERVFDCDTLSVGQLSIYLNTSENISLFGIITWIIDTHQIVTRVGILAHRWNMIDQTESNWTSLDDIRSQLYHVW